MIITDSAVSEALAQVSKMSNTATVLVPGNYLLPMSMVKGGHQITIVSGGSKILAVKPIKIPANGGCPTVGTSTNTQVTQTTQVIHMNQVNSTDLNPQLLAAIGTNGATISSSSTTLDNGTTIMTNQKESEEESNDSSSLNNDNSNLAFNEGGKSNSRSIGNISNQVGGDISGKLKFSIDFEPLNS